MMTHHDEPPRGSWLLPGSPARPLDLRLLRTIGVGVFLGLMLAACVLWAIWGR